MPVNQPNVTTTDAITIVSILIILFFGAFRVAVGKLLSSAQDFAHSGTTGNSHKWVTADGTVVRSLLKFHLKFADRFKSVIDRSLAATAIKVFHLFSIPHELHPQQASKRRTMSPN